MNNAVDKYLEFERRRYEIRKMNQWNDSEEENEILSNIDEIWEELTEEDRQELNRRIEHATKKILRTVRA